ncbi:DUF2735 domain-containing protein [Bradyrhizobium sp. LHD-71]|uniref:DUF2735 domain-containing protein n=1 Tax=Bradyrhizobium sp. LHD-71 TaxID=3072141 RepID=UPI00280CDF17|nr:DUF2735 domain-containing protein [Bradyrhizobium sp. LHD-71]MDQ8727779.1 DUF2735 domain-containing protein [Bradyrhizobium sp. LHD-71]
MSTSSVRSTAQIIQFPTGGRRVPAQEKQVTSLTDLELQAAAAIAVGDAWYHDAAVQDARRMSER